QISKRQVPTRVRRMPRAGSRRDASGDAAGARSVVRLSRALPCAASRWGAITATASTPSARATDRYRQGASVLMAQPFSQGCATVIVTEIVGAAVAAEAKGVPRVCALDIFAVN